jgi:predicted nucleic acid-binding protein
MTDLVFVDSNLILYVLDRRDPARSEQAKEILLEIAKDRSGVVSTQVVNEVANVCTSKLQMSAIEVTNALAVFRSFALVQHSLEMTVTALKIREDHGLNFWDALIIASAASAGCKTLYTEDLNSGQTIAGVKVVDPFA